MPEPRKLPPYVLGAKRAVWEYIERHQDPADNGWTYFRVISLPEQIAEDTGSNPGHHQTLSRALSALAANGYIEYRAGNRGQASMARLIPVNAGSEG